MIFSLLVIETNATLLAAIYASWMSLFGHLVTSHCRRVKSILPLLSCIIISANKQSANLHLFSENGSEPGTMQVIQNLQCDLDFISNLGAGSRSRCEHLLGHHGCSESLQGKGNFHFEPVISAF